MAYSSDFLLVSAGRVATALVALVSLRIVTTLLEPAQYGELALLIALQMFCGLFLINPIGQYLNRHTHQWWDDGTLLSRLTGYRRYILVVALVGAAASFAAIAQGSVQQSILVAGAMLLMVVGGTWNTISIPMLNMLGYRGVSVILAVMTALLSLIVSIILVNWSPTSVAWFYGQALGMSIGAFVAGRVVRHHARHASRSSGPPWCWDKRELLEYCLPLAVATGFMWLQLSGYRFVIQAYWGLEALGFLAVGLSIAAQIFALAESLVQQYLYPLFYRRITMAGTVSNQSALSDLLNIVGPLYLLLAGAVFLGTPYLLKLLVAPEYTGADIFVRLGVAVEFCRVLGSVLSKAAQVTKKTHSMALPYTLGAIVAIGLIAAAGEHQRVIQWAGFSLAFAAMVMLMTMSISMYRQVAFTFDLRQWLAGLLAMCVLCLLTLFPMGASGWIEASLLLAMIGIIGGGIMTAMLWKNSALQRLLAVRLHEARDTK